MASLTIAGRKVTVGDEFLSMTPDQQNATVEEIAQSFGLESGKPEPAKSDFRGTGGGRGTGLEAALIGARQGATFGLGDEINAGVRAAGDWVKGKEFKPAYDDRLRHERALLDQVREENPVSSIAGEIGGAVLMPGAAIRSGGGLAGKAAAGIVAGGTQGAVYGFGSGEGGFEPRRREAAAQGTVGAALGAVAPVAAAGIKRALDGRAVSKAVTTAAKGAPSVDDLRAQSSALYEKARGRGVTVKPEVVQTFADDVARTLADQGLDPVLTPRATQAVKRVQEIGEGGAVEWKKIELARQVAGIASRSPDPNERRLAGMVTEKLDDFVLNLMDEDLAAGNAEGLAPEVAEARRLWKQMRGSERLAGAIETAKDSASGYENGLRVEFRKIVKDRKFFRTLSEPEQEAVRQVVRPSATGTMLRLVAGLSFGSGNRRNVLGGLAGSSVGGIVGGPVGALAAPAAGYLAERAGETLTRKAAERAQGIVAAGGLQAAPSEIDRLLLENALGRMRVGGMVGINSLARE